MPSFFHSPCDSPRSPYERHNTRAWAPRDAYNAMAPPARQTKSAACALTTNNRSFDKSMLAPANQIEKWETEKWETEKWGTGKWGQENGDRKMGTGKWGQENGGQENGDRKIKTIPTSTYFSVRHFSVRHFSV